MKQKYYTSNGGGDVVFRVEGVHPPINEIVAQTGSAPDAMAWAGLLQQAYERGRDAMAEDMRELLITDMEDGAAHVGTPRLPAAVLPVRVNDHAALWVGLVRSAVLSRR